MFERDRLPATQPYPPRIEDGWKSPWRINEERRRAEEKAALKLKPKLRIVEKKEKPPKPPRPVKVKQPKPVKPPKPVKVKVPKPPKPPKPPKEPKPVKDPKPPREPKQKVYRAKKDEPPRKRCPYNDCNVELRTCNTYGLCTKHYVQWRRAIHQPGVKHCKVAKCFEHIRVRNKFGMCRVHARREFAKQCTLRKKEARAALKAAA